MLVLALAGVVGLALALGFRLSLPLLVLAGVAAGGGALALEALVALRQAEPETGGGAAAARVKLVDTSAIIDGRLADIAASGFLEGRLVVPRFVLRELQRLADGGDAQKRARGKRGFEVLQRLQGLEAVTVEIVDDDVAENREVDLELIELARRRGGALVTTDYNLNRFGDISGIMVLNVNDLANAMKPAVLPGAVLRVQVLREGKEPGQGVGFLEDGTMVVVDQGRQLVGQEVTVLVTSALQTSAGRMIFGQPRVDGTEADGSAR